MKNLILINVLITEVLGSIRRSRDGKSKNEMHFNNVLLANN